jgi:hypothetical protein
MAVLAEERGEAQMTEQEWMQCATLESLLPFLRAKASDRKKRLLAAAACRKIWHLIPDDRSRRAVEIAERFADGKAKEEELAKAAEAAQSVTVDAFTKWEAERTEGAAAGISCWAATAAQFTVSFAQRELEKAIFNAGIALVWSEDENFAAGSAFWAGIELRAPWPDLIREILGNPFRKKILDPSWQSGNNGIAIKLAKAIYDEPAFDRLPILADAVEEAGCTDADILNHCRQPSEHVRGCWVVDLILGKT